MYTPLIVLLMAFFTSIECAFPSAISAYHYALEYNNCPPLLVSTPVLLEDTLKVACYASRPVSYELARYEHMNDDITSFFVYRDDFIAFMRLFHPTSSCFVEFYSDNNEYDFEYFKLILDVVLEVK